MDSWQALRKGIDARLRTRYGKNRNDWPLTASGNSLAIDISDTSRFGNLGSIFNRDIYIMSYLISDIFQQFSTLRAFTNSVCQYASAGSQFVFIDRNGERWEDVVKSLAADSHINLGEFHRGIVVMRGDERVADLGQIFKDVNRTPRLRSDAFWVVGTKG